MTANTTVDILKYTAAATPKTSGAKSFTDKSGNFTSILDTANKSYTAQDSSAHNSNDANNLNTTNTNKISTQNTNNTTAKTVNKKADTDNNNKADNKQSVSQTDNNNTDSTKASTTAQEPVTDNTNDTEKTIASAEAKADAAQAAAEESEAKTTAAVDDAAENEKAASDLKTALDEKAADTAKTNADATKNLLTNLENEKTIIDNDDADKNQVVDANTTNTKTASTSNETDAKNINKSDSTEKEEADDTEENTKTSLETANATQVAIDLTNATLSKAVENIITSLPQAVNTDNNKPVDPNANNIQAVQATDKPAQEDLKININSPLNQITNSKDITAKELNNVNIPSKIQLNTQQENAKEPAVQQASPQQTEVSKTQNPNVDTPVIKVSTEAVVSDINLNSHAKNANEKENIKNNPIASITQEIIDKTNAKITSVQGENTSDSSSNNLLNKQHAGEQAIKFAIENNSNDKENTQTITQAIGASTQDVDLTTITANPVQTQPTSSTNFAKTLEGVQAPVETPKEVNKSDILSQINNKLGDLKDEGTTKINIILRPENLGKLNLELVNSKEGLTAQITADSAHVKELLDKNIDSLKDTLGSQGVNVNNVSVKVAESAKQDSTNYFEQQNQQNNQQQSSNKQSSGQGFTFKDEANNFYDTAEASSESEDLTAENTDNGKIDYKV